MVEWSTAAGALEGCDCGGGLVAAFLVTAFLAGAFLANAFFFGTGFFATGFLAIDLLVTGIGIDMPGCPACWAAAGADRDKSATVLKATVSVIFKTVSIARHSRQVAPS